MFRTLDSPRPGREILVQAPTSRFLSGMVLSLCRLPGGRIAGFQPARANGRQDGGGTPGKDAGVTRNHSTQ